jgi:MFS family permease
MIIFSVASFVTFILMVMGLIQVWHLLFISFVSGAGWAIEFPSRRSFIGDVLLAKNVSLGVGLDLMISNLGRFVGPVIAGLTIEYFLNFTFLFSMTLYLLGLIISLSLFNLKGNFIGNKKNTHKPKENIFKFLIKNNMYRTVLLVTIVCNIWGFPTTSMVPVIADTILGINATLLGVLVGAEGAGCLIGSILIAGIKNKKLQSYLFVMGAFIFLGCIFLFSLSEIYLVSLLLLFIGGLGVSGFSTMQSVITVDRTKPELRGSAMGYLSTTIGTQPLGAINVGLTCSLLVPHVGIRVSALEGIICLITVLSVSTYFNNRK